MHGRQMIQNNIEVLAPDHPGIEKDHTHSSFRYNAYTSIDIMLI